MAAPSFAEPLVQHLTQDLDLSQDALTRVLDLAAQVKRTPQRYAQTLAGRYISLLFEKPSLRTRMTFELAIKQLGGDAVTSVGPVGEREPVKDVARNLERWTQGIVARVFSQDTVQELAQWAHVPVINALSDLYHPCQALADVQTIKERFGRWEGLKLAFVGDGNNVAHSLMLTAGRLGMHVVGGDAQGLRTESAGRRGRQHDSGVSASPTIRWRPSMARMWSTPTCGPAWVTKAKRIRGCRRSLHIVWTRR